MDLRIDVLLIIIGSVPFGPVNTLVCQGTRNALSGFVI